MAFQPIAKKEYYSIGEVCRITGLKPHVLRYWETQFKGLVPVKNRAGNRIYTNRDIKLILYIKKLLRDERYTIEGAKQVIAAYSPDAGSGEQLELLQDSEAAPAASEPAPRATDNRLRSDMIEMKKFLEELLVRMA